MKKQLLAVLIGASAMAAVPAMAAGDMYAGLWLGQTKVDVDVDLPAGVSEDDSDTFLSFGGGFKFSENAAVEVAYNDFGEWSVSGGGQKGTVEMSSLSVAAVGAYPLSGGFSILGKIGLEMWDAEGGGVFSGEDEDGTDIFFGFGGSYDLTEAASARIEYQMHSFDFGDEDADADVITVGFTFGF